MINSVPLTTKFVSTYALTNIAVSSIAYAMQANSIDNAGLESWVEAVVAQLFMPFVWLTTSVSAFGLLGLWWWITPLSFAIPVILDGAFGTGDANHRGNRNIQIAFTFSLLANAAFIVFAIIQRQSIAFDIHEFAQFLVLISGATAALAASFANIRHRETKG